MRTLFISIVLISLFAGCKKQEEGNPSVILHIPNAFRPDDNDNINSVATCDVDPGCNRVFKVGYSNPDRVSFEFEMSVSNANEEVFHTKSMATGWIGRKHQIGDLMPQGIYKYIIRLKQLDNGSVKIYTGEVLLLR